MCINIWGLVKFWCLYIDILNFSILELNCHIGSGTVQSARQLEKALYDGEYVLGVFIDFSKAFGTVNHDLLLHKIYAHGIWVVAYDCMKSYLSYLVQYMVYNNVEYIKRM